MKKKKSGAGRRKSAGTKSKLFFAVISCVNLLLSLLISLLHRWEILHAVRNDEGVQLLLTSKEETRAGKSENA